MSPLYTTSIVTFATATTTYYLLPTTYYLLPITCYLLPYTFYLLPTTYSRAEKPHNTQRYFSYVQNLHHISIYVGQRIFLYMHIYIYRSIFVFFIPYVYTVFLLFVDRSFTPYFKARPVHPTITMVLTGMPYSEYLQTIFQSGPILIKSDTI
jgi:hypothetical protein